MKKLLFCLFLSVALTVTFIPANLAFAEDGNPAGVNESAVEDDDWWIVTNGDKTGGEVYLDGGKADLIVTVYSGDSKNPVDVSDKATYQWSVFDYNDRVYIDLSGETGKTYTAYDTTYFRCWIWYNGEKRYADFWVEIKDDDVITDSAWDAYAYKEVIPLVDGKATLQVSVTDADGQDIKSQCSFAWHAISIKDGMPCIVRDDAGDGPTHTVTEVGHYSCMVGYQGTYQDIVFRVLPSDGEGPSFTAHEVQPQVHLQDGKATLQVYVTDRKGNDITGECSYKWYRSNSLSDESSELIEDVGTYDGKYETNTVTEAGIYHCIAEYQKKYPGETSMACVIVLNSKEEVFNLAVKGLKVTPKKKAAVVKWTANKKANGYVIQYGLKKNNKKAKIKIITKTTARKATIKKLKSKKNYYFRIAPYSAVTNPITGEIRTVKGKWSKYKKVKIK